MRNKFELWFFGNDGEFSYHYGTAEYIEYLFRNPRLYGFTWEFDGDGWYTTLDKTFEEANQVGGWLIIRES